jgi:thiol-disulfide isomerase/thioredoxin
MLRISRLLLILLAVAPCAARAEAPVVAASSDPVELALAAAVKSPQVTIVHFWAPWCPNCRTELREGGWNAFIDSHPDVHFIFVTLWNPADGHEALAKAGVGNQMNFQLLLEPNGSKGKDRVRAMLGMPISWIPTTWIFKDGHLTYAMNYGELRFPMLQQLIVDSGDSWEH